jgi:polyhydroxyalkanoate synthesis regulator phasin
MDNSITWILGGFTTLSAVITIIVRTIQDTQSGKLKVLEATIDALKNQVSSYEGQLNMLLKLVQEKDAMIDDERKESALLRQQNVELTSKVKILEQKVNHLEAISENKNINSDRDRRNGYNNNRH